MSHSENTQLTKASGYNTNRIFFSKHQVGNVPGSSFTYKRINILTKNLDGSIGELILPTERCFSFGVSENLSQDKKTVNGFVLPLCLWTKDAPTQAEKDWVDTFDAIIKKCGEHLLSHKDELEEYEMEEAHLKKLNPLYWKKEKGKKVEGQGPTLYAKLIQSKKLDKIMSIIEDERGNPIDPMSIKGKYCYVKAAIKIESIYIGSGNKYSIQVKLYQSQVRLLDSGMKRLLRPDSEDDVSFSSSNPMLESASDISERFNEPIRNDDDDDDTGSIRGSDDEEEKNDEPAKKIVKKVVKKVVKKPQ